MKSSAKYFTMIALCLVIATLGGVYFLMNAIIEEQGVKEEWLLLSAPPERALNIVAPYHIKTISGNILFYDYSECPNNCWKIVQDVIYTPNYQLPISECGWYPNTTTYSNTLTTCEEWGPGGYYKKIWAVDTDGNIWLWEKASSEGSAITVCFSPFLGFFFLLLLGLITTSSVAFTEGVFRLANFNSTASASVELRLDLPIFLLFIIPTIWFISASIVVQQDNVLSLTFISFFIIFLPLTGIIIAIIKNNQNKIILGLIAVFSLLVFWIKLFKETMWLVDIIEWLK